MNVKAAGKYHHGDLRSALVEAALDAIGEEGPQRFSLRALAQRLNVSHAAAYRHFRNKDALLQAVAIEGLTRLAIILQRSGQGTESVADTMLQSALAYVRFGLENAGLYQVMFSRTTQDDPVSRQAADDVLAVSARLIEQAQQAGQVRSGNAYEQARAAWAMVHGLLDLELRRQFGERRREDVLEQAENLLGAFFQGLITRG